MHLNYLSNVATYFLLALCSALILLNINWTRHSSTCLGKYLRLGLLPSATQQRHLQCDIVKPPSWIPNNLVQLFKRVQLISDCPELAPLDSSIGRLVVFHSDTEVWPITLNLIHEVLQKLVLVNPSTGARVATVSLEGFEVGEVTEDFYYQDMRDLKTNDFLTIISLYPKSETSSRGIFYCCCFLYSRFKCVMFLLVEIQRYNGLIIWRQKQSCVVKVCMIKDDNKIKLTCFCQKYVIVFKCSTRRMQG